jgi:lipoprotein-anchoring transpeptidase ErfK/SrfK
MKFRQWKWLFAVFLIAGAVFLMKPQAALAAEADDNAVNAQTPTAAVTETVPNTAAVNQASTEAAAQNAESATQGDASAASTQSTQAASSTQPAEKTQTASASETPKTAQQGSTGTVTQPKTPKYVKTVEDGTYVIASHQNGFKVLDVSGGSAKSKANIQLYDANGSNAQKFDVKWVASDDEDGGYYLIVNKGSGKVVDICGGADADGTNIWQYDQNGTDAQKWEILPAGDGAYYILAKKNGKVIDVQYGSMKNGTNIWLYSKNGTKAQKFNFLKSAANVSVKDGVYTIVSKLDDQKVLDISGGSMGSGANLQLYKNNGTNAQKFIITKTGGTYRVTSLNSGMTLDIAGGSIQSGTNVRQYFNNNTAAQRWVLRHTGDGTCYLVAGNNGANVLDVSGGKTADGTNLWVYAANGSDAQKFYLKAVAYNPITGEFIFKNVANQSAVLDIKDGSRKMQANLELYKSNGTCAQKFTIVNLGNGFVKIRNEKSRHVLDAAGAKTANGTNVQQYRDNGTMAQRWIVHQNADGSFSFINANSSRVLDAAGGKTGNGTNIQLYSFNNSNAQKFVLAKTTGTDYAAIDYSVQVYRQLDAMDWKAQGYASSTGYAILVDCSHHLVSIYKGYQNHWTRIQRYSCGDGAARTPTKKGVFTVGIKERYFGSSSYRCWYATQFSGNYLFHSVLYYPASTPSRVIPGKQLGRGVSHGCVRLALNDAKWIYDNIPRNTRVVVYS